MLFTVRRPHLYESGFCHPAMRMFQPRCNIDLEDLIFPTASTMSLCGSNIEDFMRIKKSPQTTNISKQKNSFDVKVDVQDFSPEELEVKTVDNCIVVTGKHEERQDEHGYISRQFVRRYALPEGVKEDAVTCNMSSNGVLHISAPLPIEHTPKHETIIPISFTATAAPATIDTSQSETKKENQTEDADATPTDTLVTQ